MSLGTSPLLPAQSSSTPSSSSSSTMTPTLPFLPHSSSSSSFNSSLSSPHPLPHPPALSALRVNTDFNRLRSNSQAPPPAFPLEVPHHHFSRSMSHSSPISPGERGRDVMLAVNGLRAGMEGSSPLSSLPLRPSSPFRPKQEGGMGKEKEREREAERFGLVEGEMDEEMTMKRIREAAERSNDEGDTLDLSRRGIDRIGPGAVDMFRKGVGKEGKGVWRLALSYNSLRDGCIDISFSKLSRLRYLNLKGNNFTVFPQALTEMPALEILDLSKNRLSTFPDVPGKLTHLKVLSLTNNKLYTLPAYLVSFHSLKVFKVDANPIEWPPREVLGALVDNETSRQTGDAASMTSGKSRKDEDLRPWIENMKSWMRQRSAETDRLLERMRNDQDGYLASEEEPASAISPDEPMSAGPWANRSTTSLVGLASQQTIRPPRDDRRSVSPRSQSSLEQRNRPAGMSDSLGGPTSPVLHPPSIRHDRSASVSSNTPPISASTASSSSHSRNPSMKLPQTPPIPASASHTRGASYTATQRLSGNLTAKKSLPDLRQSHAKIIADRRDSGGPTEETRHLGMGITSPASKRIPLSPSWDADRGKPILSVDLANDFDKARTLHRKGSADMLRRARVTVGTDLAEQRNSQEGPLIDESRNSYFRRLSTLPMSTISKAISPALLKFVDAIRGILFALSQLHSALRQYLVFAVNERVAAVFARVMGPAGNYMNTLINALDRFDSMSRRNTPPMQAIRGVLNATKESVAVFAKVVAVLRLQVSALRGNDVRYTRTLLLMIYGSMAEVVCSWTEMAPLLAEIKPLLSDDGAFAAQAITMSGIKMNQTGSFAGRTPISPIPERGESHSPPSASRTTTTLANSPLHQTQNAEDSPTATPLQNRGAGAGKVSRRQGGSFSSQDVERGMLMGSPREKEQEAGAPLGYTRHRPSESAQIVLEQTEESEAEEEMLAPVPSFASMATQPKGSSAVSIPATPPELHPLPQPIAMMPPTSPRRGHRPSSSSGSSHALSLSSGLPHPVRKLSVDVRPPTPASATLFDEDLLDVIETATDTAFTVWLKLAEDIGASDVPFGVQGHTKSSSQSSIASQLDSAQSGISFSSVDRRPPSISAKLHAELVHLLSASEQITSALRESLMGLRANPFSYAHTTLPDDAQAFIKTVVKVSELVKIISSNHTFPSSVRQSISRLTQVTRECAILMQVSSLRPGSSTPAGFPSSARSFSPMHYSRSSQGGAGSSSEDLQVPQSAIYPGSAGWGIGAGSSSLSLSGSLSGSGSGGAQTPTATGLRGLQLPSRQAAMGIGRSRTGGEGGYFGSQRGHPRSALPGQVAF